MISGSHKVAPVRMAQVLILCTFPNIHNTFLKHSFVLAIHDILSNRAHGRWQSIAVAGQIDHDNFMIVYFVNLGYYMNLTLNVFTNNVTERRSVK